MPPKSCEITAATVTLGFHRVFMGHDYVRRLWLRKIKLFLVSTAVNTRAISYQKNSKCGVADRVPMARWPVRVSHTGVQAIAAAGPEGDHSSYFF